MIERAYSFTKSDEKIIEMILRGQSPQPKND